MLVRWLKPVPAQDVLFSVPSTLTTTPTTALSKAFNSMSHGLLLRKLTTWFGLSSTACRLIESVLGGPRQRLLKSGEMSQDINDTSDVVRHCRFHFYADDLQIYNVGLGKLQEAAKRVNSDLEMIRQWSIENMLMLNMTKTQGMGIARNDLTDGVELLTIDGDTITWLNSVRNLGL
jgi:hypothetical protein